MLVVLAASVAAWRWGAAGLQRAGLLFFQRQCLAYVAGAEQVVYEEEPATVAALLADRSSGFVPYAGPKGAVPAAVRMPECWRRFSALNGQQSNGAMIFMHEMRWPGGEPVLVSVRYTPDDSFNPTFISGFNLAPNVIIPATLTQPSGALGMAWALSVLSTTPPPNVHTRIYAGQLDPADPSHFTFRYEMWDQEDVVDARLSSEGEITFTPRHPPQWRTPAKP